MELQLTISQAKWQINGKPLSKCSKEKKKIFEVHLLMKKFKMPVETQIGPTFKNRSAEVKEKYNHKFVSLHDESLDNYPNIEKLIFVRKPIFQFIKTKILAL